MKEQAKPKIPKFKTCPILPDQERGFSTHLGAGSLVWVPTSSLNISVPLDSPQQVRLTPPCSCGFYDGLLILLLQLLTQVQVRRETEKKQRGELGGVQNHQNVEMKKQPLLACPLILLLTVLAQKGPLPSTEPGSELLGCIPRDPVGEKQLLWGLGLVGFFLIVIQMKFCLHSKVGGSTSSRPALDIQ